MRTIKQEYYFPVIISIHFILWWIDLTLYKGSYEYTSKHIAGEVFSSWVVTVLAANFLMATRAKWVERIFGGLDKMYMIHRRSAVIAVVLLILHFVVVPRNPEFSIGKPMGFYSLVLILIGVILAAAPVFKRKLKYNKWLVTHKLMGLFYVLGIAHSLNVPTLTSELPIVRSYVYGMALVGIAAWFYKAFLYGLFNRTCEYTVKSIKRFENDVLEVSLEPANQKLAFNPGQFAFVSFSGTMTREAHPFTISSHSSDNSLRFTIKALGDYTADLQNSLKEGTTARVRGSYGHFDFKKAKHNKQIWLAGGIGITPFLSFLREVSSDYEVTFIWSVRSADHANYKDEIEQVISDKPNVNFVLWDSGSKGFFTIDRMYRSTTIEYHSIFICGPEVMRESHIKQLLEKGVPIRDIHYEEFSFR
ncbi:MAG: ferric reductase-like transmembrane domain-containing protein [candidate division Zixibacteria bacterium]|nr:ferric reductase-like transmembrane domain-containing protein [candidate division Zixibacteria bacterium]